MKDVSHLNYLIISAGCVLIISSALAGCGRSNDQAAGNDVSVTQTNNATTDTTAPPPVPPTTDTGTSSASSSATSGMTPNTPTGGPSSGVPVPQDSSRVNHVGTTESTTVAPGSESARADTNAAPATESGSAPSEKSK